MKEWEWTEKRTPLWFGMLFIITIVPLSAENVIVTLVTLFSETPMGSKYRSGRVEE